MLIFVPLISSMQSMSLINRTEQKRNQEEVLIDGEEECLSWSKSILGSQLDVHGGIGMGDWKSAENLEQDI